MNTKRKAARWLILLIISSLLAVLSALLANNWLKTQSSPPLQVEEWEVDKALREMNLASIVFNTPPALNIEDRFQVHLALSLKKSISELKKLIFEAGKKDGAIVKASNRMEATLTGTGFQTQAIGPEIQAVSKEHVTDWMWMIQPTKEGTQRLYLTLIAHLDVDGHSTPRTIETFSRTIEIEVKPAQRVKLFIRNNWQWLWAAILVPVVGWILKKKGPKSTTESNS